jgi:hypothetical protein
MSGYQDHATIIQDDLTVEGTAGIDAWSERGGIVIFSGTFTPDAEQPRTSDLRPGAAALVLPMGRADITISRIRHTPRQGAVSMRLQLRGTASPPFSLAAVRK